MEHRLSYLAMDMDISGSVNQLYLRQVPKLTSKHVENMMRNYGSNHMKNSIWMKLVYAREGDDLGQLGLKRREAVD